MQKHNCKADEFEKQFPKEAQTVIDMIKSSESQIRSSAKFSPDSIQLTSICFKSFSLEITDIPDISPFLARDSSSNEL
jgi:hypothetical protein